MLSAIIRSQKNIFLEGIANCRHLVFIECVETGELLKRVINIVHSFFCPLINMKHSIFYEYFSKFLHFSNKAASSVDNSKLFAGIMMILLNVGSKFINIQFSKSTEEYLKMNLSKQILVFAMAWLGTREIYSSLMLTISFIVLSEYLFNEESEYCIVPKHMRVLNKLIDTNDDGVVSETEMNDAIAILEKAKKQKRLRQQKDSLLLFQDIIY